MPMTIPNQNIAHIASDGMDMGRNGNYAHYPPTPFYPSQYTLAQIPPVADLFWNNMHQYYRTQGSNIISTSSQQLTNGQDGHWQETQIVQMTERNIKDASANAQS
eukprot:8582545-Ditylum_brightwellii.AAC.1